MNNYNPAFRLTSLIALILIVMMLPNIGFSRPQSPAQQHSSQDEDQRDIIRRLADEAPKKIARSRPKRVQTTSVNKQPDYKFVGATTNQQVTTDGVDLGFTMMLLKESKPGEHPDVAEPQVRRTVIKSGKTTTEKQEPIVIIPQRVNSNTQFNNGDWLRFNLDIPVSGYVYIFNREKFTDSSFGTPALIFPRKKDLGKSDHTVAGKLLFIPNSTDYFEIAETTEPDRHKSEEVYYVLVTPTRLPDTEMPALENDQEYREFSLELFEKYQQYSAPVWKFESTSEAEKAITKIEKLAATDSNESLSDADPLPQTVYHIAKKIGEPIFFTISAVMKK